MGEVSQSDYVNKINSIGASTNPPPFVPGTGLNNFDPSDFYLTEVLNASQYYQASGDTDLGWYGSQALMWYYNSPGKNTPQSQMAQLWHKAVSNEAQYSTWKAGPSFGGQQLDAHYANLAAVLSVGYQAWQVAKAAGKSNIYLNPVILQAYILAREGNASNTYQNYLRMLADPNGYKAASLLTTLFIAQQDYDLVKNQINKLQPTDWAAWAANEADFPTDTSDIDNLSWDTATSSVKFSGPAPGSVNINTTNGNNNNKPPAPTFPYLLVGSVVVIGVLAFFVWREVKPQVK